MRAELKETFEIRPCGPDHVGCADDIVAKSEVSKTLDAAFGLWKNGPDGLAHQDAMRGEG